jgi:hypothetical protein
MSAPVYGLIPEAMARLTRLQAEGCDIILTVEHFPATVDPYWPGGERPSYFRVIARSGICRWQQIVDEGDHQRAAINILELAANHGIDEVLRKIRVR